jgi:hypothetical protein
MINSNRQYDGKYSYGCMWRPAQVVRETAPALKALGACTSGSCWLWPSITQRAYQTGEILAALLGVGRSRLVPEYSFLDPRSALRVSPCCSGWSRGFCGF